MGHAGQFLSNGQDESFLIVGDYAGNRYADLLHFPQERATSPANEAWIVA